MGTKNNPGSYNCYADAKPDEPIFVLRSTDPASQYFVAAWVAVRCGDMETARKMMDRARWELDKAGKSPKGYTDPKMVEANQCSVDMRNWLLRKKMDDIEAKTNDPE